MKNLILFVLVLYAFSTFAKSDYSLQGTIRSYPMGASIDADLGHSLKLWKSNKNKAFYGYVRPSVSLKTSGLVNYVSQQVDIFPISFFGAYVGRSNGLRNLTELQGFDCDTVNCGSDLSKGYFGVNLALAHKQWVFLNLYRHEELSYDEASVRNFAEETSNLIVKDEDTMKSNTTVLGYNINEKIMIAALNVLYKTKELNQESKMLMGLGQYKLGKLSYQLGLGKFKNRNDKNHFSGLFIIKWSGEKGLRLF